MNNGAFTQSTSSVNFNGSSAQTINGSTSTTFNNVTFNNNSGSDPNINYTGNQTIGGNTTLSNTTKIASTNNTNITFTGTVNGNGGSYALSVNAGSGTATFSNTVGNSTALPDFDVTATTIYLNTTGITANAGAGGNTVTFTGAVSLGANVTINTDNSSDNNVSFTSTINADNASNDRKLIVTAGTGTVTYSGVVGGTQALADFDNTAATIYLNATTFTVDDQGGNTITFTGAVSLGANVTIDTDGSADNSVSFTSTINADNISNDRTFTVTAGTGTATYSGVVGGTQALADFDNTAATIYLNAATFIIDDQAGNTRTFTGAVSLGANVTIDTDGASDYGVSFTSTIDADNATTQDRTLTINSGSANTSFSGNIGNSQALSDLDVTAYAVSFYGTIVKADDGSGGATLTFTPMGGVILYNNVTFDTDGANDNNISFLFNVRADDAASSNRSLTITSGNGTVTLGGIGVTEALADLDVTAATISLGSNITVNDQGGNTATFAGAVSLTWDITINTDGASDNNLAFTSTVTVSDDSNDRNLTITAGTGNIDFQGTIGNDSTGDVKGVLVNSCDNVYFRTAYLESDGLTVTSATSGIRLYNNIETDQESAAGVASFGGPVALYGNSTVDTDSTTDAAITFSSTINSFDSTDQALVLTAGSADVAVSGAIGATNDLASLTIGGNDISLNNIGGGTSGIVGATAVTGDASGTITLTGTVYNTAGTQAFNAGGAARPITLNEAAAFTTTDDTITFTGLVDSQAAENNGLTLNAGTAQVTFNNNVGATQSIGTLTKQGSGNVLFGSNTLTATGLTLSAGTINNAATDSGVWTVSGNVTISAGTLKATTNTFYVGGNFSLADTTAYILGGTLNFNGTTTYTDSNTDTKENIGTVVMSGTSVTLASSMTADKVTVTAGALNLASSGYTLTLTGSGTGTSRPLYMNGGSLTEGTNSTVKFTGGSSATEIQNETYRNLEISPAATGASFTLGINSNSFYIYGNLTINDGSGSETVSINLDTYDPFVGVLGNLTINDYSTWTKSSSQNLCFYGAGSSIWADYNTTKQDFGFFCIGDGINAKTVNLVSDVRVRDLTVANNATFTHNGANNLNLSGNLQLDTGAQGSQYIKGGTLTFDGTGTHVITDSNGTKQDLGTVVIGDGTNAKTVVLNGTAVRMTNLTVTNNATFTHNGANNLNLSGNLQLDTGAQGSQYTSGGILTFDGTGTNTITDSNGTQRNLGNVVIDTSGTKTINLATSATVTSMQVKTNTTLGLASSGYTLTLTGSGTGTSRPLYMNGGTLDEGTNSTVKFTGTSAIDIQNETYYNLELSPSGGSTPAFTLATTGSQTITTQNLTIGNGTNAVSVTAATNNPVLDINGDVVLNNGGSFTGGTQTITVGTDGELDGDFTLESGSTWNAGSGTLIMDGGDDIDLVYFNDKNGTKQNMGAVQIGASPATTNLSSNMSATSLTVSTGDKLNTRGYDLDIATSITVNGTLNCTDTTAGDGTDITLGTDWTVASGGTFTADEDSVKYTTVTFDHTGTATLTPGGTDENHDFYDVSFAKSSAATTTLAAAIDVENDLTIANSNSTLDTGTNYAINVGGSWSNAGTFTPGTGTVTFDSGDAGETIDAGGTGAGKLFYTATFNNSAGGWTIQTSDMKATNLTITDVFSWALAASRTLEVTGTYSIVDAETSATTWNTGSILYLNGTSQTIGSKTQNAESYDKLQVGANTDIRMWNSNAVNATTPYTVDSSGSLYSMDHANTDGDLYIWGDYHVNTNDYWSYAADFDNAVVTRQVDVRIDPAAKVTVDSGDTLNAIGTSSNRTTVDRQGAANGYEMSVLSGGTINFEYSNFDRQDGALGLDIQSGATVTKIDYADFDNLVGSAATNDAYITVASAVIGSATKTITGVNFDRTDTSVELNVNRTGTDDTGYWDFDASTGTYDGESYDGDDGANEADPGMLKWDDSGTGNQNPNLPSSLGPAGYIDAAGWMNDNTPTFNFDLSDNDVGQQVKYQIQIDDTAGFGSPVVDYVSALGSQGTFNFTVGQAAGGGTYTVGSQGQTLSDSAVGGGYYWQVKAIDAAAGESAFEEAGTDAQIDFRVDATAPTSGNVYDGTSGDQDWNNGSLTQISGNWINFNTDTSGLQKYEYAIRRQPDGYYWSVCSGAGTWQAGENWCNNTTSTSFTQDNLNLQTGVIYYVSVKTTDNAGNVESAVDSNGQQVLPTLSFSLGSNAVTFNNLNSSNSYTDTKTMTTTTSTNASTGYTAKAHETQLLTSVPYPTKTVPDFQGTYATPETWEPGEYGFGYTTSDTDVNSGKFVGSKYAAFAPVANAPGDTVVDHTDAVNGSTGAVSNEQFTITYKVSVSPAQEASEYKSYVVYVVTANY